MNLKPILSAQGRMKELRGAVPRGFQLPDSMSLLFNGELPELRPTFWLAAYRGQIAFWKKTLQKQYQDRHLLAFAKTAASDDLFCFDLAPGHDHSVLLIHPFSEAGWEYRGRWTDFPSWLHGASRYSSDWADGTSLGGLSPWDYP